MQCNTAQPIHVAARFVEGQGTVKPGLRPSVQLGRDGTVIQYNSCMLGNRTAMHCLQPPSTFLSAPDACTIDAFSFEIHLRLRFWFLSRAKDPIAIVVGVTHECMQRTLMATTRVVITTEHSMLYVRMFEHSVNCHKSRVCCLKNIQRAHLCTKRISATHRQVSSFHAQVEQKHAWSVL